MKLEKDMIFNLFYPYLLLVIVEFVTINRLCNKQGFIKTALSNKFIWNQKNIYILALNEKDNF